MDRIFPRAALLLIASFLALGARSADTPKFQQGRNYELINAAPAKKSAKIEVVEFFWYACSTCYTLEPHVVIWNRRRPQFVEFVRVPATWDPQRVAHARLYYTLVALGREDLHHEVFDTIHRRGNRLYANDDAQTLKEQADFAAAFGIDRETFVRTSRSREVGQRLEHARQLAKSYRVQGIPTLVVNGRYFTNIEMAGKESRLLQIVNYLVQQERSANGAPVTASQLPPARGIPH